MWKLKSNYQINHEKKLRESKYDWFLVIITAVMLYMVYRYFGSVSNIVWLLKNNPELLFVFLFIPFTFYLAYRNFVVCGSLHMRPGKICLGCEKGMGYSDDGWGYRSYGLRKKRWYQIKSCTTPEKCDIHFLHEVEWVQNNSKLQSSNDVEESGVKPINFTISIEDVGSIIFFILFVLAIFAAPILVLWGLYFMVEIST